jgi:hypothetical protein
MQCIARPGMTDGVCQPACRTASKVAKGNFKWVANVFGCDGDPALFEAKLGKLAKVKPAK